jgi:hypothetical protein
MAQGNRASAKAEKVNNMANRLNSSNAAILSVLGASANGISIGEAFVNWQLSGGHFTKIISELRRSGHNIKKEWRFNPVTKRRYARYFLLPGFPVTCAALRYINGL